MEMKAYKLFLKTLCIFMVLFFAFNAQAGTKVADLPKEAIKAMYLAQQALQEKKYDETIIVLEEYMKEATKPIPLPAYQMLGYAWYEKKEPEKTRQVYEKAHKAFPDNAEMLQNYTILTYETGNLLKAGQLFEKLYRLKGSTDKKILYQASGIYYQAENFKEAKRVLTQLLNSKGEKESRCYEDMIAICLELKDWLTAEKWAKTYLEKDPAQARYWRLLAQMRLDREEYKAAASALEIAYRLENAKSAEWRELSDLYMYLNAPLMAARCTQKAFGNNIPEKQKIRLARIYARTQRFDKGISYLNAAYKENPSAQLLFEKGRMLYDAGRYKEAIEVFAACTKMDKKLGNAYILAGFAAWNIKAFEKARSFFAAATVLPKHREQANDAVLVLDDLMAAMSETAN
ncbi:MAG: tetratricopeptide repeat protein [Thermodesulfobacteriota bacterium]